MKCYWHAKAGQDRDAVAVCTVCGRALCADHAREVTLPLWPRASEWTGKTAIQILDDSCLEALGMKQMAPRLN
jgi:hypothetical protein